MGVSKESISKFLIGNRFHVKLRILSPYSNRINVHISLACSISGKSGDKPKKLSGSIN